MRPVARAETRTSTWQGRCSYSSAEGSNVLLRFTETIRLRVFGRVYNYRRGEVHRVSLAMVGLLLAEDCVEPVDIDAVAQVA